jgi:glucose/arabinose dehydrogenase
MKRWGTLTLFAFVALACGCGGGGGSGTPGSIATSSTSSPTAGPSSQNAAGCTGATASQSSPGMTPSTPALTVPAGLVIQAIASVGGARELVGLPNGDLLVGTSGSSVYIVPNAEASGAAGTPKVFATVNETVPPGEPSTGINNAEGVAFSASSCTIFIATEYHVWSTPYKDGDLAAENLQPIATVRTGPTANPGDGDYHTSTSVAVSGSTLFASMGSSCNGCTGETDPQRAAIWKMGLNGSGMTLFAEHIRNAIALAVDPASGHVWAGGAGQDDLTYFHPYEFMDDVTAAAASAGGIANYGWSYCEENHALYNTGTGAPANCNAQAQPLVEFPAYITHIGAAFYPTNPTGSYALPTAYRGALIVTSHGSWHGTTNGSSCTFAPQVDDVPMQGDTPTTAMTTWGSQSPTAQYSSLVTGFQTGCSTRSGRATGVTVGSQGSVFVGDDQAGLVYRIRP